MGLHPARWISINRSTTTAGSVNASIPQSTVAATTASFGFVTGAGADAELAGSAGDGDDNLQMVISIVIAVVMFGAIIFCGVGYYRKANSSVKTAPSMRPKSSP